MATNVAVSLSRASPMGGVPSSGMKMAFIDSAAKAAQNDTWTVGTEVKGILGVIAWLDSTGVMDACTFSSRTITLTGAGTGASSGVIFYV